MKKTYIKLLVIIIGLAGLTSCSDWLQIQPEGKVTSDVYWKTENDVAQVVNSCYLALIKQDNKIYSEEKSGHSPSCLQQMIVWGEFRSDNLGVTLNPTADINNIYAANILPKNYFTKWASFYEAINYCNVVLENAPKVVDPNYSIRKMHAHMAEALTIRALCYFYLVRAFKDVPLVLTASNSDLQDYRVKQSKESEVLDQIVSDLLIAEDWAVPTYTTISQTKGRITTDAVRALLADIYLWRQDYANCVVYCDKIMSNPNFKLLQDIDRPYYKIFGQGNSVESIFELQCDLNTKNNPVSSGYGAFGSGTTDAYKSVQFIVPDFIAKPSSTNEVFVSSDANENLTKTTDNRRVDFITDQALNNVYYVNKYVSLDCFESSSGSSGYMQRSSNSTSNWIIYRLSDIMLMKAEALTEMARTQDDNKDIYLMMAFGLVNTTYMRSNPSATSFLDYNAYSNPASMEELVLLERQRELMFEGKRWFDLLRKARRDADAAHPDGNTKWLVDKVVRKYINDTKVSSSVIRAKMTDMNSMYWPINQTELSLNHNLVQNPYYDSDTTTK